MRQADIEQSGQSPLPGQFALHASWTERRLRVSESLCLVMTNGRHPRPYAMPRALAHAAAKRELVATQRPDEWTPPSILRSPEVLTERELIEAEGELKALQRHALEIVSPEIE
jgi:hypothetical protein